MPSTNKNTLISKASIQIGLILLFSLISLPLFAQNNNSTNRSFLVQSFHPDKVQFQAYHSYKYNLILLSFQKKKGAAFQCQQNQYVFYDYKKQDFFQIEGSDLKISPDFQRFFYGKLFRYGKGGAKDLKKLQQQMSRFAKETKASSKTLKAAMRTSADLGANCWQQAAWQDRSKGQERKLPFLLASFCKTSLCPSFEWQGNSKIQTWGQLEPKHFQQLQVLLPQGKLQYQKTSKPFYRKERVQGNAARENLITNQKEGSYTLPANKRSHVKLSWSSSAKGIVTVTLQRDNVDVLAAKKWSKQVQQTKDRTRSIPFGLWLDPDNEDLIYSSLLSNIKPKDYQTFFKKLRYDFNYKERIALCRKIHADKSLVTHWKENSFISLFQENCP